MTVTFTPTLVAEAAAGAVVTLSTPALQVRRFAQEHPENVDDIPAVGLPYMSVQAVPTDQELLTIGDRAEDLYSLSILIISAPAARDKEALRLVKYWAARVRRVLQQQHLPDKQLDGLPAVVAGGDTGSVEVSVSGPVLGTSQADNSSALRGVAEEHAVLAISTDIPED